MNLNFIIQILEDMLRACILDFDGSWKEHLPLAKFTCNNIYQASICMVLFEALYGIPCRYPMVDRTLSKKQPRKFKSLGNKYTHLKVIKRSMQTIEGDR